MQYLTIINCISAKKLVTLHNFNELEEARVASSFVLY